MQRAFRFELSEDVKLDRVVKLGPKNVTGADYYGLCSNAWMSAVRRLITNTKNGKTYYTVPIHILRIKRQIVGNNNELKAEDVVVTMGDFQEAMKDLKPSIKPEDLVYFEKLNEELNLKR